MSKPAAAATLAARPRADAFRSPRAARLAVALLLALLPASGAAQRIGGVVLDGTTREPVAAVLVQLIAADSTVLLSTFTDPSGHFVLASDCAPHDRFLYVSRLGYRALRASLRDLPEDCASWSIVLDVDAVALPVVEAAAERNRDLERTGFYDRQRLGFGSFITRAMLDDRYRTLDGMSEVFAQTRGVMRVQYSAVAYSVFFQRAQAINFGGPCPAFGYIDGLPYGTELPRMSPGDVEAIEIYRGPSEVPVQYGGRSRCGVILIWTRTGAGR